MASPNATARGRSPRAGAGRRRARGTGSIRARGPSPPSPGRSGGRRSRRWCSSTLTESRSHAPRRRRASADKEAAMLWTLAMILLVLWALGMISSYSAGGLVHLLLVIAVVIVVFQFLGGR